MSHPRNKPSLRPSLRRNARRGSLQILVDVGLALGLLFVLGLVFAIDRKQPPADNSDAAVQLRTVPDETPSEPPPPERKLRLGVTPPAGGYDNMGRLLKSLGEGYKYTAFDLEDLRDQEKIGDYDVVFLTCSGVPLTWLKERIGASERAGADDYTGNEEVLQQVADNLRHFVEQGHTLYASDLHYRLVAKAFPEIARELARGKVQDLNAEVVDDGLRELIGGEMPLKFDQAGWFPAGFEGQDVTVYLRGKYTTDGGAEQSASFMVRFPIHDGTVIFTSFHNEKQNSETELKLLRYLVFSAVTAEVETKVERTMVQGGFSPAKKNLFSASAGEPSATSVYHSDKGGHLQFVLGFQNAGAELKLTVEGPDGKKQEKQGTSTITIDLTDAAAGDWKYTVTAIKLPNENFPFTVTVGQK
ncbi:MAG TPA: hypothetical protein VHC22_25640 [Pirellulales bacterium]|nr:hypothetical protein [Pirellulales bacterium]